MSTIRCDNFGPSAGGTTYSARGIAKAWVNFDGTGTIAARDSENVSSLTDNGSGDYTVNFSNAFGAADYAVGGTAGGNRFLSPHAINAGDVNVRTQFGDNALSDANNVCPTAHGDLA